MNLMISCLRSVAVSVLLILYAVCFPFSVSASAWYDDFDSVDADRWFLLNETNNTILNSDGLFVRNIDYDKTLYLQTKNSIGSSGGVEVEVKFKFSDKNYNYGAGIAVSDVPNTTRILEGSLSVHNRTIAVWPQANKSFAIATSICTENSSYSNDCDYKNSKPVFVDGEDFSKWHILKIVYENSRYKVFLDNTLKFTTKETTRALNYVWVGNPEEMFHFVTISEFTVDYIKITDLNNNTSTFPYLSQKDSRWANVEYDSASKWSNDGIGIDKWGCALTSVSMIFHHMDIKSPDGRDSTPLVLNEWLNNQPDGYVGNGLLNWVSLTRYAKESKDASYSSTAVEFERYNYDDTKTYEQPSVLGLDGHFVVGVDESNDKFDINDPLDENNKSLDKSLVKSVNVYKPSNTDLSYLLFYLPSYMDVELLSNGQKIGSVYIEPPLKNDDTASPSGDPTKLVMLPKPHDGNYELLISNNDSTDRQYDLKSIFYNKDGVFNVSDKTSRRLPSKLHDTYEFKFSDNVSGIKNRIKLSSIRELTNHYYMNRNMKRFMYKLIDHYIEVADNNNNDRDDILNVLPNILSVDNGWIDNNPRDDILNRINDWN